MSGKMWELIEKMFELMGEKKDSNKMLWDHWKRTSVGNKVFSFLTLRITDSFFPPCGHWFRNIMPKK